MSNSVFSSWRNFLPPVGGQFAASYRCLSLRRVLVGLSALLFCVSVFAHGETFTSPPILQVPGYVGQVLAGDLRGTGVEDLICVTSVESGTQYVVLRNDGQRHFTRMAGVNLPTAVTGKGQVADFNGDGKLDIVFLSLVPSTVPGVTLYFLAGNGDGTFAAPVKSVIALTNSPSFTSTAFVYSADMNGDGVPDIVINLLGETEDIDICAGSKNGTFSLQATLPNVPGYMAAPQDLNDDGLPDLVVYTIFSTEVTTYLNKGHGIYKKINAYKQTASFYPSTVHSLRFLDMDGDGIPDMVWEDGGNYINLAKGQGDGTFVDNARFPFPIPYDSARYFNEVRDMNGDGIPDLIFASDNAMTVMLGKGGFEFQALNPTMISLYPAWTATTADLDADGFPDIALPAYLGDASDAGVLLLWGAAGGELQPVDAYYAYDDLAGAVEGRFTQGPAPDLAVGPWNADIPEMLKNNGAGIFQLLPDPNPVSLPLEPGYLAAGDFNGDGKLDLLEYGLGGQPLQTWPGRGDGTFNAAVPIPGYDSVGNISAVAAGDLNKDGITDIAVAYDGGIDILLGRKDGSWTKSHTFLSATYNSLTVVKFADFNNDNILDIAILDDNTVQVFLGLGNGEFAAHFVYSKALLYAGANTEAGDVDGDGNSDLLVPLNGSVLQPLYGNGDGTFEFGSTIRCFQGQQVSVGPVSIADVNQDGWPDIVVYAYGLRVLHGLGKRQWALGFPLVTGEILSKPMVADLNQDGFPDIAVAGNRAPMVATFLNHPAANELSGTLTLTPTLQAFGNADLTARIIVKPGVVGEPLPTGQIEITVDGVAAGSGTLSKGAASVALTGASALAVGHHWVVANYSGDGVYHAIRMTAAHQVYTTATALSATPNPAMYGSPVTLSVAVSSPSGIPAGTVQFLDGATILGPGTLSSGGRATIKVSTLSIGTHALTVNYSGETNFPASSSAAVSLKVTQDTSKTVLAVSPNPANAGSPVTLTATVTGASGTPTGTVAFHVSNHVLASVPLSSNGIAQVVSSALPVGADPITADYSGDPTFLASVSNTVTGKIVLVKTATALACTPVMDDYGSPVTCTATVTASGSTPTGTVKLFDGTMEIGNLKLSAGIAVLTNGALSIGAHSITASFAASTVYAGSVSAVAHVTVRYIPATFTLSSSSNPGIAGKTVTFTATVLPSEGSRAPSGTVAFTVDGALTATVTLNASHQAGWVTNTLAAGSHTITATYSGSSYYAANHSSLTETIKAATAGTAVYHTVP